jgi:uncharacterized membrane protein
MGLNQIHLAFIGIGITFLSSCTFHQSKEPPVEANFASINQFVFQPKCVGCHNPENPKAHGIDFTNYAAIFSSNNSMPAGKGFIHIIDNQLDADGSALYKSVVSGKMPPGDRSKLSKREIDAIRTWLSNGGRESEDESSIPPPAIDLPTDRPPINDD